MASLGDEVVAGVGLNAAEVRARVDSGLVNTLPSHASRSIGEILRANVLTRFNAILGGLLVVVAVVGPVQDGLFGVVLVLNATIGVVQELRAKVALDRLAVLSAPVAHLLRDGSVADRPVGEVVVDDVLDLRPGDEVVADAVLVSSASIQVDESLLTGESLPVDKRAGDEVLSGSVVVSGTGRSRVVRVGADAYAQRLQLAAKRFAVASSQLQQGTNTILRVISWVIAPVAALLVTSQLVRSHVGWEQALRGSVAGVGAMVPEGLVLLTTLAFAIGALRLARRRVLVQSLPAIEGLARVDVVCLDKTGTLTMPGMTLERVVSLAGDAHDALGAIAAADVAPNATMAAIGRGCPSPPGWRPVASVPFSSARKWSAVEFEEQGSWILGAPDVLFDGARAGALPEAARVAGGGRRRRVLALARSCGPLAGTELPGDLVAAGLVELSERLRPEAGETVGYLLGQGVAVKVISGDDPETVAETARLAGVPVTGDPFDARRLPEEQAALAALVAGTSVFGRVHPEQKKVIVEALQALGHVVAMTGDGVNDVPALKQADVGIAMGTGSQASRAVANIVLLDSAFSAVPPILAEGRRVIANIERVANLFVTKTVYAALLALVVGVLAVPYPFYPRQLTVVSSLTIGIPGFVLALAPGAPRAKPDFLRRVLQFTAPAGAGVAVATLAVYTIARGPQHASTHASSMAAAVALFAVAIFVLAMLARPLRPLRLGLVLAMGGGGVVAMLVPISRRVFSFSVPPASLLATVVTVAAPVMVILLAALWRQSRPVHGSR